MDDDVIVRWRKIRKCAAFCATAVELEAAGEALCAEVVRLEREIERLRRDKGCARREALLCSKHEELWLDKAIDGCGWCVATASESSPDS